MKQLIFATLVAASLFIANAASAQTRTPRITQKQYNQHARIRQGVRTGTLTHREATALRMRQARIQGMKRMAKSDGVVTRRERAVITREQRKASRAIYMQKHNRRMRHF